MRYLLINTTTSYTSSRNLGDDELINAVEAWLSDPESISFYIEVRG